MESPKTFNYKFGFLYILKFSLICCLYFFPVFTVNSILRYAINSVYAVSGLVVCAKPVRILHVYHPVLLHFFLDLPDGSGDPIYRKTGTKIARHHYLGLSDCSYNGSSCAYGSLYHLQTTSVRLEISLSVQANV